MLLHKAFELVEWTDGQTGTNPAVGCIIEKHGKIVGIGAHLIQGEAHAEINALKMAGEQAQNATLYCTLEPCTHFGKTPPCAHAIVEYGIKKVVFAVRDQSLSESISYFEDHNIEVEHVYIQEIEDYYAPFFKAKIQQMPFTIIKMGLTMDGKSSDDQNNSKWITNRKSRLDVHKERYRADAILVGYRTYKLDQPILDARDYKEKKIKKIVICSGKFDINPQDLAQKELDRLLVITTTTQFLEGVNFIQVPDMRPQTILKQLYQYNINRLIIEGGMYTVQQFITANAFDEIHQYIAPKLLGGSSKHQFITTDNPSVMADATALSLVSVTTFDDDVKLIYRKRDLNVYRNR